ncbi:hypothetical protein PAMP_000043 [Pampus punctatissimus]
MDLTTFGKHHLQSECDDGGGGGGGGGLSHACRVERVLSLNSRLVFHREAPGETERRPLGSDSSEEQETSDRSLTADQLKADSGASDSSSGIRHPVTPE